MATGSEATDDNGARRTDNYFVEDCGAAYFWPSREGEQVPNQRVLQGELEVGKGLKPSFKFPKLTIRVSYGRTGNYACLTVAVVFTGTSAI